MLSDVSIPEAFCSIMIANYRKNKSISFRFQRVFSNPAFWLFIFFLSFYYLTNAGWYKIGDESFIRSVAKQLATKGKISFRFDTPQQSEVYVKGEDGYYYTKWGLGQSLVETPFYWIHNLMFRVDPSKKLNLRYSNANTISELLLIFICPSAVSALGCTLIFLFGLRLGFSNRVSILLSLIYGIGTMAWPYSKSLMSETTCNAVLLGGIYGATNYTFNMRTRWLAFSGICMGFALITKFMVISIVPVVIAYVLFKVPLKKSMRDLLIFFAPGFLFLCAVQCFHNSIRYDSLFDFGYDGGRDVLGFCTPLYVGLWGMFLSPGKSFFLYTPVAILGLISFKSFFHKKKAEASLFIMLVVAVTLPHACWWAWAGDWAWGPRFLLLITPYIILPIGVFLEHWKQKALITRVFAVVLMVFSLWIQILGVSIHPFSFIRSRTEVVSQFVDINAYTYAATYSEQVFANFSPMFSHILGNWWLFKHMIFSYDIWQDVPWKVLGDFHLATPPWVAGSRTIPYWWPVAFPSVAPDSWTWVFSLAIVNFLFVVFAGLRLRKLLLKKS